MPKRGREKGTEELQRKIVESILDTPIHERSAKALAYKIGLTRQGLDYHLAQLRKRGVLTWPNIKLASVPSDWTDALEEP